MPGRSQRLPQMVINLWHAITGKSVQETPAVIVHDPAAQRAHDLDDPFFDNEVQSRMADVIADSAKKD